MSDALYSESEWEDDKSSEEDIQNDLVLVPTSLPFSNIENIFIDESDDISNSEDIFDRFFAMKPCCKEFKCCTFIPKKLAINHRQNFDALEKREQDLIILAQLQAHRQISELRNVYIAKKKPSNLNLQSISVERQKNEFYFANIRICKSMFLFLHNVGKDRFENLIKHYDTNGVVPRIHKLSNIAPPHVKNQAIDENDVHNVVQFLKSYGTQFGLPLPGRVPNCKKHDAIQLPANETKASLYRKYCESIRSVPDTRSISESSFRRVWDKYCPHILITRPKTDLCDKCRELQLSILRAANLATELKLLRSKEYNDHLVRARKQREYYNSWRNSCVLSTETDEYGTFSVYSFDFAQNVNYPHSPMQVGSEFFTAKRKCSIFGIHDERSNEQYNFLIDEEDEIGKGPNTVISLIHYFLESQPPQETLIFFADNCVGQNKNNAVIHYFLWRVRTGRNKRIFYNFLAVGHTKFSPDRGFGILKKKYNVSFVDCLEDLVLVIEKSSEEKHLNKAIITWNPITQERTVDWYDWVPYFRNFFRQLPGLTSKHHFIFEQDCVTKVKDWTDSPTHTVSLDKLDTDIDDDVYLKRIIPEGLKLERQWFLYMNVRPFVIDETKKDKVVLKPPGDFKHFRKLSKKK